MLTFFAYSFNELLGDASELVIQFAQWVNIQRFALRGTERASTRAKNKEKNRRNTVVHLRDVASLVALLLRPCDLPYRGMENEVKRGEKSFCPEQVDNQRERKRDKSEESSGPTANGKCNLVLSFSFPLVPCVSLFPAFVLSISPRYHTEKRPAAMPPASGYKC